MKNYIYKIALVLSAFVFTTACENSDDATGDSVANPTNPSLSVTLDFPSSQTLVEMDASYDFTVTLSEPQIASVDVKIAQTGGTATEGLDFEIPHSIRIPAGATSATGTISILKDDIVEETETVEITIGSGFEANVSATNSETVSFTITNLTEGDLVVGLDWGLAATITDNYGNEIEAYDAADLRLLLTDVPYTTIFDAADGASAESYTLDGAAPDGEYYMVADFYAAISEIPVDINLTLTFDQIGIINGQTHTFDAALNTGDACADLHYILAKITKTGESYMIEEVGEKSEFDISTYAGTYSEISDTNVNGWLTDGATMTVGTEPNELIVEGIYYGLYDFWGETFQPGFGSEGLVSIFLNADGTVTLPNQYVGQTLPGPYDYYYNGEGTYNLCDKTITLSFAMQFDDTYSDDYQPATIVFQLN